MLQSLTSTVKQLEEKVNPHSDLQDRPNNQDQGSYYNNRSRGSRNRQFNNTNLQSHQSFYSNTGDITITLNILLISQDNNRTVITIIRTVITIVKGIVRI